MSSVLKRVFANPRVTPGVIVVLVIATVLIAPRVADAVSDARERRAIELARHWTPKPWALTAADFADHDTEELAVDPGWMTDQRGPGWNVDPFSPDGIAPLFYDRVQLGTTYDDDWELEMDATEAVSGVRVDEVDVYTYVSAPWGRSYSDPEGAFDVWDLQENAARIGQNLVGWKSERPEPHKVLSAGYIGDRVGARGLSHSFDKPFDGGDTGYFGVTTHQRGGDGSQFRTTTIATVVEGSLAVVGVVVPDGVEPSADLEPALLLERLSAEVRADPPSHTVPSDSPQQVASSIGTSAVLMSGPSAPA
ncbi:hypothetical protein [Isoptericola cucumis]|uniref:Uncharacterized protein n=1 Tax=Isoptericola cucumis TaxID=1776856 RepID=A0ABQ2B763_9MICO|nr:hypothetical protein [Isoptericola cucumis]GGI09196.1 hypothetical protein GCM10007368_24960 [Isoptericola cucumis]